MKKLNIEIFSDKEMVFIKISMIYRKILKITNDHKMKKSIAKKGKEKYMKYFNSNLVAEYIVNKTLEVNNSKKYFWEG